MNVKKDKLKNRVSNIILICVAALVAIATLAGTVSSKGYQAFADVFIGTFGISLYGICAAVIVFCSFSLADRKIEIKTKYLVNFVLIFVLLSLLVHMFTSFRLISASGSNLSFGEYIASCYDFYSYPTFGGAFFGLIVYPLVSMLTIWGSAILLILSLTATLWVAVGFFNELANTKPARFRQFESIKPETTTRHDDVEETPETPQQTAFDTLFGVTDASGDTVYPDVNTASNEQPEEEQDDFSSLFKTAEPAPEQKPNVQPKQQSATPSAVNANNFFNDKVEADEPEQPQKQEQPSPFAQLLKTKSEEAKRQNELPKIDLFADPDEEENEENVEIVKPVEIFAAPEQKPEIKPIEQQQPKEDFSSYGDYEVNDFPDQPAKPIVEKPKTFQQPAQEKKQSPYVIVNTQTPIGKDHYQEGINLVDEEEAERQQNRHVYRKYIAPDLDLLNDEMISIGPDNEDHSEQGQAIVNKLASFKIKAEVRDIIVGPTVTRYVVEILSETTRMDDINKYANDLKACLKSTNDVIIYAPLQGTSFVGIDTANKHPSIVHLRSVMTGDEYKNAPPTKGLVYALGKDVAGKNIVGDLTKMPHMLIAGATNMGKSVCINSLLVSMMYKYSPEYVRFLLVDPKQVEFSMYERSPHLLTSNPVIDPVDALSALDWLIDEMERRFTVFKCAKVKNIAEYNANRDKNITDFMNYIVLVVDELAELMTAFKKQFEPKITRLTQKARAAGIHIILATQRPSIDIITGTIKNNLPCRVALKVTSYHDSQTVLDIGGAESLIGRGDLLYKEPMGQLTRVQGAFLDTKEIYDVLQYIQENNETYYDEKIYNAIFNKKKAEEEAKFSADVEPPKNEDDPLLRDALIYWLSEKGGRASISSIQRKLAIGFNRAGRIVEKLTALGYIEKAPDDEAGNKPMRVLISADDVDRLFPTSSDDSEAE